MVTLLYVTALLNVALGAFTFLNRPRARKNIYFFMMTVGIAGWAVSNALFQEANAEEVMFFWAIVAYQIAAFMLLFVWLFSHTYTDLLWKNVYVRLIGWFSAIFGILAPLIPDLITTGVDFEARAIKAGRFLPVLFLTYLFLMLDALVHLWKAQKHIDQQKVAQLRVVFWGLLSAVIAGITTNIVLPSFQIYAAVAIGPSFTLIFLSFIAYAIIRHRFLDIRVLIGRITYFLIMASLPFFVFFFLVWLYERLFGSVFSGPVYLISPFVAVAFVIVFNSVNAYIKQQVTTRLINPGYDPAETVEQFSNLVSLLLDLEGIFKQVATTIGRTIRPAFSNLMVFTNAEDATQDKIFENTREGVELKQDLKYSQIKQLALTIWKSIGLHPVVADDIDIEIEEGLYKNIPNLANDTKLLLQQTGVKVVLPISTQDKILGILLIGQKEADSPYTRRDVDFIGSIAASAGVAIQRSLLYTEVQDFANTLQGKVDEATKELKASNTQLAQALANLKEIRRREKDMVDVMGHELRTPISIVRNGILMLERKYNEHNGDIPKEELKHYITMTLESARREIRLVETLLSATKVDASRLQLILEKVDMADVVNDALEGHQKSAEEKELKINYVPPAEGIIAYADRTRAQEIMDNFLSNAIKYTPSGSITISLWKDKDNTWASVADTGMGIDEGDIVDLGKKFFRAKQYVPRENGNLKQNVVRPGGTGLGLYVVFELIRIMDGKLFINSTVGQGTTFTFSLPLHTGQPDKQFDQTFEAGDMANRGHITINGQAPVPPKAN